MSQVRKIADAAQAICVTVKPSDMLPMEKNTFQGKFIRAAANLKRQQGGNEEQRGTKKGNMQQLMDTERLENEFNKNANQSLNIYSLDRCLTMTD